LYANNYVNPNKETFKERINEILAKYEHSSGNQKYLFFPAQQPKCLIICFSAMHRIGYSMWSWFYNLKEIWKHTAYLFLNEKTEYFYLGPENQPTFFEYKTIIDHCLKESHLSYNSVMSIGHSMGGYAALYYALTLGFKAAIVSNPIVYADGRYKNIIATIGANWKNIPDLIQQREKIPHLYLQFGNHFSDYAHAQLCIQAYQQKNAVMIVKPFPDIDEHGTLSLDGSFVPELVKFFFVL
jgi:hypothetical protein